MDSDSVEACVLWMSMIGIHLHHHIPMRFDEPAETCLALLNPGYLRRIAPAPCPIFATPAIHTNHIGWQLIITTATGWRYQNSWPVASTDYQAL